MENDILVSKETPKNTIHWGTTYLYRTKPQIIQYNGERHTCIELNPKEYNTMGNDIIVSNETPKNTIQWGTT